MTSIETSEATNSGTSATASTGPGTGTTPASELAVIARRGFLRTSVSQGIPGLSQRDGRGPWRGIDTDFARVVAAALLEDSEAIEWRPVSPSERIASVGSGASDLGACNTSWTLTREEQVRFIGVLCHDGEGFLVHSDLGVSRAEQLGGRRLVVQAGSTSTENLARWHNRGGPAVEIVAAPTPEEALRTYVERECDGYVLDRTGLAGIRSTLPSPEEHTLLSDTISDEPLSPFVSAAAPGLFTVARWCLHLLIAAEAAQLRGEDIAATADPLGPRIGLSPGWATRALSVVGHYGDLYARNLGHSSPLDLPRGLNEQWFNGGSHYAPLPR
ncbi:transporter substrate-binding domain-containing protein [Nocardiopsis valliformis]|uniref:transporter substrate-binding domain-containing protein n=1 Tax=Nocardiopsis valliformis TaxID=239974 RepID=UPI000345252B|nr:transporter substrate-binding domain-containing protein [Nocardiopsis valliformis]